ncbi:MAG: hypothetical protein ACK5NN_00210 [Sphingomonadaceae bacterium]
MSDKKNERPSKGGSFVRASDGSLDHENGTAASQKNAKPAGDVKPARKEAK